MTTPDLQPTQPITTYPSYPAESASPEEPRGPGIGSFLLRIALLLVIGLAALVAAALVLTPTREAVLIMGSDARPDEIKSGLVGRTDTMMLYVADRAAPHVALLSIPRDLWVTIPGQGEERINAAYEFGGSAAAKQTVSNLLGQPVDRYLVVGLQGVRDVVDAAGGVDITVPYAIHDDTYPTDDYGYQTVDIKAGPQHMDGDLALKYARTRHQDNDFARNARQQQVLGAVRNAMLNPVNWPRIPAVAVAVLGSIKTDANPLDVVAIGAAMLRSPGETDHMVIDTTLAREETGVDGAYLLQAKPELRPAVARFLDGSGAASSSSSGSPASSSSGSGSASSSGSASLTVEVLNGAGVPGLAARTAERLTQAGFKVSSVADAPQPAAETTIAAKPAARSTADKLASTVGLPSSRVSTNPNLTTDIQITLGADAR